MSHPFVAAAVAAALAAIVGSAFAVDNTALVAFARANVDKYAKEISPASRINVGSALTVRGYLQGNELASHSYEPNAELIEFSSYSFHDDLLLDEKCRPTGSFTGSNNFGVKVLVRRSTCERFVFHNNDYSAEFRYQPISAPPSLYRLINRMGVEVELDVTVEPSTSGVLVNFYLTRNAARIHDPREVTFKNWQINGRIEAVRWVLPGPRVVTLWERPSLTQPDAVAPTATPAGLPAPPDSNDPKKQ
jgi:hypothetical protein